MAQNLDTEVLLDYLCGGETEISDVAKEYGKECNEDFIQLLETTYKDFQVAQDIADTEARCIRMDNIIKDFEGKI